MSRKEVTVLAGIAQDNEFAFRAPFLCLRQDAQGDPLYQVGSGETDPAYTVANLQVEIADGAKITIFDPPLCFDFPDNVPEDFIVLVVGHSFEQAWTFPYPINPPDSVRVLRDGVVYIGGSLSAFLTHYKSTVSLCLGYINDALKRVPCELKADDLSAQLASLSRLAVHDADLCDKVLILRCALLISRGRPAESAHVLQRAKVQGTKNPAMIKSQSWRLFMSGKLGVLK